MTAARRVKTGRLVWMNWLSRPFYSIHFWVPANPTRRYVLVPSNIKEEAKR